MSNIGIQRPILIARIHISFVINCTSVTSALYGIKKKFPDNFERSFESPCRKISARQSRRRCSLRVVWGWEIDRHQSRIKSLPKRMRNVRALEKFDVEERHFALCTRGWRTQRCGAMRHTAGDRYIDAVANRAEQHVETRENGAFAHESLAIRSLARSRECGYRCPWHAGHSPDHRTESLRQPRPAAVVPETPRRTFLLCRWCSPDGAGCIRFPAAHSDSRAIAVAPRGTWVPYLWSGHDSSRSRIRSMIHITR